ncbi:RibD family protein, partial [Clostridium perfringens]|uniref:RibD family protein n=1 Tax=Clostridium perfringens TaxID=1502 RepID=UPI002AC70E90
GIDVVTSVLEEECKKVNEVFMKYIVEKKPFVVLKTAMTLDGKISTSSGESKWITNEKSRKEVHKLRNKLSAIMVGVNTVIKDNPELTCRLEGGRNPIRIIVDSALRIPMESKVVIDKLAGTIVATTELANKDRVLDLKKLGVE